ncbi:MAG: hypothetical protein WC781_02585 [Candidatus Pacearchaeota archaeon]|jgi:hypothetical protein
MAIQNVTNVVSSGMQQSVETLVAAVGVIIGLAGIYLIFWIINLVVSQKKNKLLKEILENVKQINRKLNKK